VITGILFGLAPAFHGANANPQESLKEGTRGAGGGRHRVEGVFVAVEIGLAVILLAGAGLMMQSVWRLLRVDPGFNTRNVLTTQVALSPTVMASPPASAWHSSNCSGAWRRFRGSSRRPSRRWFLWAIATARILLAGHRTAASSGPDDVGDVLCRHSRLPQRDANPFAARTVFHGPGQLASPPVVVIDEVLAKHVFPGQDPVGQQISLMAMGPVQIVGVVGHVKHWGLDSDDTNKIRDQIYFPVRQVPDKFMSEAVAGLTLALRTARAA
jgi:hypothetical protein